jgi:hypothetical protein
MITFLLHKILHSLHLPINHLGIEIKISKFTAYKSKLLLRACLGRPNYKAYSWDTQTQQIGLYVPARDMVKLVLTLQQHQSQPLAL